MERPHIPEIRPSTVAWGALIGSIAVYECLCPDGELMTEGFRDGMRRNKFTRIAYPLAAAITAGHLMHAIPDKLDPFVGTLKWKKPRGI